MLKTRILLSIRTYRTHRGYSQEYLSSKLNISQKQYSRIENGERSMTLDVLLQICSILQVNLIDLISNEDDHSLATKATDVAYVKELHNKIDELISHLNNTKEFGN